MEVPHARPTIQQFEHRSLKQILSHEDKPQKGRIAPGRPERVTPAAA
jgi:hypothetical protein